MPRDLFSSFFFFLLMILFCKCCFRGSVLNKFRKMCLLLRQSFLSNKGSLKETKFPWRLTQLSTETGREEHVGPDVTFPLEMTGSHLRGLEPSQSHQPKGWSLIGTVKQEVRCCTETTPLLSIVVNCHFFLCSSIPQSFNKYTTYLNLDMKAFFFFRKVKLVSIMCICSSYVVIFFFSLVIML